MTGPNKFAFNDAGTFDDNTASFSMELSKLDCVLAPILSASLPQLASENADKTQLLKDLFAAASAPPPQTTLAAAKVSPVAAPALTATKGAAASGWFLEQIEIEGFRGINNEGSPLVLKLKTDCVNSISAPNGVGKSSIFDALSFALTGGIPKLDRLLLSEKAKEYYLNRFHPGDIGTIKLTLMPDNGGAAVAILVTRATDGSRTVTGPAGIDADALLADLNREFVLLDSATFHSFIDLKALDRGRSFSGLLGLSRYSTLRQQLQALCHTRAFNTHFDTSAHTSTKTTADQAAQRLETAISKDFSDLVKSSIDLAQTVDDLQAQCHAALSGIPVLTDHCKGQRFDALDFDKLIGTVKTAEGGPQRERLVTILSTLDKWAKAARARPDASDVATYIALAERREDALQATAGVVLNQLYKLSKDILTGKDWPSPSRCPTCERDDGQSVLDLVESRLNQYSAADKASQDLKQAWNEQGWSDLGDLETLALLPGEQPRLKQLTHAGINGIMTSVEAKELAGWIAKLRSRAATRAADLTTEKAGLEKVLPPLFVTVTTAIETARRLKGSWSELARVKSTIATETAYAKAVSRVKQLLDGASSTFAEAESDMAAERLRKVQPLCQDLFKNIMFSPVVPALEKPPGSEELAIKLAEFYTLKDVSAQALLSESFRNGFAVSVYLAAASLYGGLPRFILLDDVTSSFDAGHQHHLVEVIRTRFARPIIPNGPQLILLSHDTLLEKLFNRHSNSGQWSHQRLEGTARTAVLPQSGAVNKVRDTTLDLLNAGRVDDAAPRIRQYLEYTLQDVIDRCRVPVPLDIAFNDEKRTAGEYLGAITAAVALHKKAGSLVLDPSQQQKLTMHSASIVGNFLSHWATGQTQAFSAPALLGVMQAIEEFPTCFQYVPAPGQAQKFYRSLEKR